MLGTSVWTDLGLAVYALATTWLTYWLAVRLWGRGQTTRLWATWSIAGNFLWSVILFFAGIIAARYIERVDYAFWGYGAYALIGFLLSLLRARLRLGATQGHAAGACRPKLGKPEVVHNLAYLLLALVLFLLISWPAGGPDSPLLLIPLFLGALLPDLDASDSLIGRLLPAISRPLEARIGHKQAWHTPAAALVVATLTLPLALLVRDGLSAWYALLLGFVAHLLLDLLTPRGIMLLWPPNHTRYHLPRTPLQAHGGTFERNLVIGLAAIALILLLLVGLGPQPPPPAAPAPSYEQTLDRYRSLRGQYLVFAYVQGTWQTSGLRLSGRFEVLAARDRSYVLLDRYTGKVFTAGRAPEDEVYLDSISLQIGSQVQIKPAEILLEEQLLANGLDVLYEMQREPGLEYIYVFGDIVLATDMGSDDAGLPVDRTLTGLPRIWLQEPGHYHADYLTAAELVDLAGIEVETASLIVVATYTSPPAGPTATPLPPMPVSVTAEAAP